eukprot:CAMPEP_0185018832 /NCGR_PEP_ID=MMETSP1103-20130426/1496_1 /TAXON_ID=36769 /ORGANISM="Paraphysomonas bandaiensis, Strain Caron Lab Isolate" /LENGTH=511 /DNA_ID=CAMNT_0027548835 /DNA_START=58 /DNA_END=1593 /DNA_ORIENTATION=+
MDNEGDITSAFSRIPKGDLDDGPTITSMIMPSDTSTHINTCYSAYFTPQNTLRSYHICGDVDDWGDSESVPQCSLWRFADCLLKHNEKKTPLKTTHERLHRLGEDVIDHELIQIEKDALCSGVESGVESSATNTSISPAITRALKSCASKRKDNGGGDAADVIHWHTNRSIRKKIRRGMSFSADSLCSVSLSRGSCSSDNTSTEPSTQSSPDNMFSPSPHRRVHVPPGGTGPPCRRRAVSAEDVSVVKSSPVFIANERRSPRLWGWNQFDDDELTDASDSRPGSSLDCSYVEEGSLGSLPSSIFDSLLLSPCTPSLSQYLEVVEEESSPTHTSEEQHPQQVAVEGHPSPAAVSGLPSLFDPVNDSHTRARRYRAESFCNSETEESNADAGCVSATEQRNASARSPTSVPLYVVPTTPAATTSSVFSPSPLSSAPPPIAHGDLTTVVMLPKEGSSELNEGCNSYERSSSALFTPRRYPKLDAQVTEPSEFITDCDLSQYRTLLNGISLRDSP